jgi:hypothetical protein
MFTKRRTGAKGKLRPHACEGEGEGGSFDDGREAGGCNNGT